MFFAWQRGLVRDERHQQLSAFQLRRACAAGEQRRHIRRRRAVAPTATNPQKLSLIKRSRRPSDYGDPRRSLAAAFDWTAPPAPPIAARTARCPFVRPSTNIEINPVIRFLFAVTYLRRL